MYASKYLYKYFGWGDTVLSYLCYHEPEQCVKDWEQWLSVSAFPLNYIALDFIYLIACYINLYFTSGQISLLPLQMSSFPKLNDSTDFISGGLYKKYQAFLLHFLYSGFPILFIAYLFFLATTFHGTGMTDLLSVFYLFYAFYFILYLRKLYTRNSQMLQSVRNYNIWVFYSILIFQAPVFLCPAVVTKDNSYWNQKECASEM